MSECCVSEQLESKQKQRWSESWSSRGARPSCWTPTMWGRIQTEKIRGQSSQQRMEERSGAESCESLVIASICSGDKQSFGLCLSSRMMQTRKNMITQSSSCVQLGFSERSHIFLYLCLNFYQCLKTSTYVDEPGVGLLLCAILVSPICTSSWTLQVNQVWWFEREPAMLSSTNTSLNPLFAAS